MSRAVFISQPSAQSAQFVECTGNVASNPGADEGAAPSCRGGGNRPVEGLELPESCRTDPSAPAHPSEASRQGGGIATGGGIADAP